MSFSSYFLNVYTEAGLVTLFATGAFAWWKGGAPERLGTLVFGLGTVGADIWRAAGGQHAAVMPLFAVDLMMALGFLYIAIRYSSLWLGAAMLLLAASFTLHAAGLSDPARPRWHGMIIYLLANNVLSYLTLLALAGGTVATIVRRRRTVRRKAGGRRQDGEPAQVARRGLHSSAAALRRQALSHSSGRDSARSRRQSASMFIGGEA